jgi:hypothetical protein
MFGRSLVIRKTMPCNKYYIKIILQSGIMNLNYIAFLFLGGIMMKILPGRPLRFFCVAMSIGLCCCVNRFGKDEEPKKLLGIFIRMWEFDGITL